LLKAPPKLQPKLLSPPFRLPAILNQKASSEAITNMASKRALYFLSSQPSTRGIASRCATKPAQSQLQARTFSSSILGPRTRVPAHAVTRQHNCARRTSVRAQVQKRWISRSDSTEGASAEDKPSKKYTFEDVRLSHQTPQPNSTPN
jgi:hypothetical protein